MNPRNIPVDMAVLVHHYWSTNRKIHAIKTLRENLAVNEDGYLRVLPLVAAKNLADEIFRALDGVARLRSTLTPEVLQSLRDLAVLKPYIFVDDAQEMLSTENMLDMVRALIAKRCTDGTILRPYRPYGYYLGGSDLSKDG